MLCDGNQGGIGGFDQFLTRHLTREQKKKLGRKAVLANQYLAKIFSTDRDFVQFDQGHVCAATFGERF
jgi:hypothetical protein